MRQALQNLIALGKFPSDQTANIEEVELISILIDQIEKPVTEEEALELLKLFGPDTFFGLAWTLFHLVGTCPVMPLDFDHEGLELEWVLPFKETV